MRIRTIKPEFWQSETLASVSKESKLIAIAILNYADDEGYFFDVPQVMRGALFQFDEDSTSIRRALDDLSRIGYIRRGTAECGKRVAHVVNFRSHQKIDRPQPSKIAGLAITWDAFDEHSTNARRTLDERSLREWKGMEGNGEGKGMEGEFDEHSTNARRTLDEQSSTEWNGMEMEGNGREREQPPIVPREQKPKAPPTEQEVLEHCAKHFPSWHHSSVRDLYRHYVSTGWTDKDGKPIKNWKNKFSVIYGFKKEKGNTGPTEVFIQKSREH